MASRRLHVTGAPGAGVTALGRALADRLGLPHHDADDYVWLPTVPPYRNERPDTDRLRLMHMMFLPRIDWVLSGALDGWGDPIAPMFDAVVFLLTPTPMRLERLREREARHFGEDAVRLGGWRHKDAEDYVEWASHYEDGTRSGRTLARQEAWLGRLSCPVIRVDGTRPAGDIAEDVAGRIETLLVRPPR